MDKTKTLTIMRLASSSFLFMLMLLSIFMRSNFVEEGTPWTEDLRLDLLMKEPVHIFLMVAALGALIAGISLSPRIGTSAAKANPQFDPNFTITIVRLAFLEAVGLFGFMLGIISKHTLIAVPFIIIAIVFSLRAASDSSPLPFR